MKNYIYKVRLCDGYFCDGEIVVEAETEEEAYEKVMDYVIIKLADALPELGIEISIECIN